MKPATTQADRQVPLLFDCCRCAPAGQRRCLTCWRWQRHHLMVMQRRKAWRAAR